MSQKKITVLISETGDTLIDLENFHGQGCSKVMSDFSDGDRARIIRHKREYTETVKQTEGQKA